MLAERIPVGEHHVVADDRHHRDDRRGRRVVVVVVGAIVVVVVDVIVDVDVEVVGGDVGSAASAPSRESCHCDST